MHVRFGEYTHRPSPARPQDLHPPERRGASKGEEQDESGARPSADRGIWSRTTVSLESAVMDHLLPVSTRPAAGEDRRPSRERVERCPFCGTCVPGGARRCEHCRGTIAIAIGTVGKAPAERPGYDDHAGSRVLTERPCPCSRADTARFRKSVGGAFLLGFLFGPLGILYATYRGALAMLCVNLLVLPRLGRAGLLCHPWPAPSGPHVPPTTTTAAWTALREAPGLAPGDPEKVAMLLLRRSAR
jgi:hypothetical protein